MQVLAEMLHVTPGESPLPGVDRRDQAKAARSQEGIKDQEAVQPDKG